MSETSTASREGLVAAERGASVATEQFAMTQPGSGWALFPPLMSGAGDSDQPIPLELGFDYDAVDGASLFEPRQGASLGLAEWGPLMPPLTASTNLGEGNTPLLHHPRLGHWADAPCDVYMKDEGRNPTWSHKDRLNRCTISAAVLSGAPGVIVASSGNHGASASAYAAAADLPCIILASSTAPLAMQRFVTAYGGHAISVPAEARWQLMRDLVAATGYHPVSNVTPAAHTGHAFAVEGYKSIAFEIFRDLGRLPGSVFVPTGYAECLYGIGKGFQELKRLGLTDRVPHLFSCEPATHGVLHRAVRDGLSFGRIDQPDGTTQALSIATTVGGLRGPSAIEQSGGAALVVTDDEIAVARDMLASVGQWVEFSAAAGLAGLRQASRKGILPEGDAVVLTTAPGLKDVNAHDKTLPETDGSFADACRVLRETYGDRIGTD